ncbi:septation protein SpoVG family protein, partial [bacterium]|nr:septation protein SpoVG family protein [bacterium]
IWKDLYNQIPRRNALVKGTRIQVSGEIGSYQEKLQIQPKSPGDIRILGAAPAALPAVAPLTPATQAPPVDTDGDGIPDTYVLTQEKSPTARPAVTPKKKPEAVSADTIQITDITSTGQDEFTLVINGSLVIKGFRKLSGQKGEWVAMPGYEKKDGTHKDLIYPITKEARKVINEAILHNKINSQAEGPIEITEETRPSSYAGTKAYGSLVINKSLALEIKVREGKYGDWVAMPSKKGEDGQYYDLTYSITPQATEAIKKAKDMVLNKYKTIK